MNKHSDELSKALKAIDRMFPEQAKQAEILKAEFEAKQRHMNHCVNCHDDLVEALEKCAAELAEEIEARYPKETRKYPSESRKYTSDMQTVMRARTALTKAKGQEK